MSWLTLPVATVALAVAAIFMSLMWNHISKKLERRGWILDRYDNAWDYFFLKKRECWIRVHLKDGRMVGGFMGTDSFASLYPNSGHLYLQEVWELDQNGQFQARATQTAGMILSPDNYNFVELYETN
jgi:hypothetical protein